MGDVGNSFDGNIFEVAQPSQMTLYHCSTSRAFRVLWTLHEMGLKGYRLVTMPFPPRYTVKGYLDINVLGTIPYFIDGETKLTESCASCHYLVEKYGPASLRVGKDEKDFGEYLNWLHHSEATITFPQTVFIRFTLQESGKGLQEAGYAYAKWFLVRLKLLTKTLSDGREFLCGGRFTVADICVTYALMLGERLGITDKFGQYDEKVKMYLERHKRRPAFVAAVQEEQAGDEAWASGTSKL